MRGRPRRYYAEWVAGDGYSVHGRSLKELALGGKQNVRNSKCSEVAGATGLTRLSRGMIPKPLSLLVTGSSGFMGTHVVRHLHAAGHRFTALEILKPNFLLREGMEFRQNYKGTVRGRTNQGRSLSPAAYLPLNPGISASGVANMSCFPVSMALSSC